MNFAKKTSAKIFIIAGLFAATVQPTNANCSIRNGSDANGYCSSYMINGRTNYVCQSADWAWWQNCNVSDSQNSIR